MYNPLIEEIHRKQVAIGSELFEQPTGWNRVDRGVIKIREKLESSNNEEDYQTVGLLCRESLISLAQAVYNPKIHLQPDGVAVSNTDAKRMLENYLLIELPGSPNEEIRRHAKAALDLANALLHRRTANFRQAAMCSEATISLTNLIAIISGIRDPKKWGLYT